MKEQKLRYGVGLDMSKKNFHVCLCVVMLDQKIKTIARRKFANSMTGFDLFVKWLTKHVKQKDIPLILLMEVTGVYHENLLHYLYDLEYKVVLEQGKRVKQFKQSIGQKSKNDKLDGRAMAEMACHNFGKLWHPASEHIVQIRSALRHRKSLIASRIQCTNKLHAINHSKYPEKEVVESLKRVIELFEIEIKAIEKKAFEYTKKDKDLFRKVEMIANSVKGLGVLTVLTVVAETNGFHDFESSKQLVSYSGYDIVENQSGTFHGKTRISKKGNVHIRTNLHMGSVSVIRYKIEPFYNFYMRLLLRNGRIKKKAMVAVQRKLLILIYTLWKKNEPFDMSYYKQVEAA